MDGFMLNRSRAIRQGKTNLLMQRLFFLTTKAKVILNRLNNDFPDGAKTCITLFKLAGMAAAENDVSTQKQYLQVLLEKKQCMETNEFLQGAEMLEEILNAETTTPVPEDSLASKETKASENKLPESKKEETKTEASVESKTEEPVKAEGQEPKAEFVPANSTAETSQKTN